MYYLCINKIKEVNNEMTYRKRLIFQIFRLLELIETDKNQPMINQIRGLLYNLLDSDLD